jgi:hypothetical protein
LNVIDWNRNEGIVAATVFIGDDGKFKKIVKHQDKSVSLNIKKQ